MQGSLTSGGLTLEDTDLGNEFVFTFPSADTGLGEGGVLFSGASDVWCGGKAGAYGWVKLSDRICH